MPLFIKLTTQQKAAFYVNPAQIIRATKTGDAAWPTEIFIAGTGSLLVKETVEQIEKALLAGEE